MLTKIKMHKKYERKPKEQMSKEYPECHLKNHSDCAEIANPRVCAIVREDKTCLIKLAKDEVVDKPLEAKQNPAGI